MAHLLDITKVEVGPRTLTATVRFAAGAPLMTSDDLEGTTRVYNLMPHIIEHVCLGDTDETFRDVMGNTEIAHLLEHMTVELLAQSNVAGDISSGRTAAAGNDGRTFTIELACPDDVLVVGALSSAAWMAEWAFGGGRGSEPDVAATVEGLVALIESLPEPEPSVLPADTPVTATEQDSGTLLHLVDDEGDDDDSARTGRLDDAASTGRLDDAASTARLGGVSAEDAFDAGATAKTPARIARDAAVRPAADVPPTESPEARQAAADVPVSGRSTLRPSTTGAILPLPSVTGNLPLSQVVR